MLHSRATQRPNARLPNVRHSWRTTHAVRSLLSVQSGPTTLVSPIGNPRSTVHALWRAFVPSTVFLLVYLAILIFMVGTRPLVSWQQTFIDFSTKALSSELRATLIVRDFLASTLANFPKLPGSERFSRHCDEHSWSVHAFVYRLPLPVTRNRTSWQ